MNESISRLMDGELDDEAFIRLCPDLRAPDALKTWECYHLIGDQLRGTPRQSPGFAERFSAALAAEPTVLAPRSARAERPATFAWAVAATLAAVTVVGWTAFSMVDLPPDAVARAREATTIRSAQVSPPVQVPADYLLAHHEYSPATVIQGGRPFVRAIATMDAEPGR